MWVGSVSLSNTPMLFGGEEGLGRRKEQMGLAKGISTSAVGCLLFVLVLVLEVQGQRLFAFH